jgi:hypothetical protein
MGHIYTDTKPNLTILPMKKPKPVCETLMPWLKANLGPRCLAPLTGTDARALRAAVQIIDLYAECRDAGLPAAFGAVVGQMQPNCRFLAYHAIAHILDWSDRAHVWQLSGLPSINPGVCTYEPKARQFA